jgi:hypothetical protein
MNARILTTATLTTLFAGLLPATAADPQLLNLVMPDAKVLAGVNVDQAKASPFGQYVLSQMQLHDTHLAELTTATGFDPTRDVHELLVASSSSGAGQHTGLVLARGNFDPARINALAISKGAASEAYNGVTILEDPKQQSGLAFLNATMVAAGDLANLKAAIDRQTVSSSSLPAPVIVQVNQWSSTQDAWAVITVPPTSLHPAAGMPPIPGLGTSNQNNAFQGIQQAAGGVKFGTNVVVTGQAQAATAQDATQIGDTFKLLASLAQLQSNSDPRVTALAQSLTVNTNGTVLNVSVSLPQDQLVAMLKPSAKQPAARRKL